MMMWLLKNVILNLVTAYNFISKIKRDDFLLNYQREHLF